MQKHVNLVDLVKSFPTNIYWQNLASIQQRTSLIKFDSLAEKSEYGSISNLSTKENTAARRERTARLGWTWVDLAGYQTSCQNAGELHAACPRPGDEQRGRDRERKEGRYIQSDRPNHR